MDRHLPRIALIDANPARRRRLETLAWALCARGTSLGAVPAGSDDRDHRLVLLVDDLRAASIAAARAAFPLASIVVAGSSSEQNEAVAAFRAGADDFVWLGGGDAELAAVLVRNFRSCSADDDGDTGGLVGVSAAIARLRAFIRKLAPTPATVLITGETGTGKDVAALAIHRFSRRAAKPLVALNCAAIPDALIEGELFGYERGAFSGAHAAYPGKLKLADGGTLLLDEVGELNLAGQAKLLRAIETREAWRLGARAPTRFDVRIIAVTNRDLAGEVRAGRFREDLFYRLAVSQLRMPPLRERPDDVLPLAAHLLARLAADRGTRPARLSAAAAQRLAAHSWPGNVRELRNALEVALINADDGLIGEADLPAHLEVASRDIPRGDERGQLIAALNDARGNKSLAAQALNCSRMTVYRRLQRLGIADAAAVG